MSKANLELKVLIQHFQVHNRTERKTDRTVEWYDQVLGMFYDWLIAEGMSTVLGDIEEMEVRRFILYYQERVGVDGKVSTHSVANRVRALKAFFAWLHRKGYTADNVLKDVREPRTVDQLIETLEPEEVDWIFSAINPNTALGARNTAIISLMLDTRARLSEVANLKGNDVHLEDHYIKVNGKGNKERIVAFGHACRRALLHYYHHFRAQPMNDQANTFFLTLDGYPMTPGGIQSMVKRLANTCEVARLHPHLMRHTYATSFLMNGGDIFLLQQNLGHSSLKMVQHYLHIASQKAAVRSQGFSPLDRLNVQDSRRFRHSFAGIEGHIYPNAGREKKNRRKKAS